jgi:predicted ABC-type ATPase
VSRPQFILVAGPNGSGKSTITSSGASLFSALPVIDPDALARTIQVDAKGSSALAAGRQALQKAANHLEAKTSFAIETTLSGHNYLRMMLDARQLGFDVILIYVATNDSDINVARVNNRVLLGGHDVPEEDIRRRYERSLANLPIAISRADYALLFDNSTRNGFQLLALFDHGSARWLEEPPGWAAFLQNTTL